MQLLLDSAVIDEALIAAEWGWVNGATTNPTLLAKSNLSPEKTLEKLSQCFKGPIFYQLVGKSIKSMKAEAKLAAGILGKQLVLKIPATELGFRATSQLSKKYTCAVTSVFTSSQALVAHASGARYALYYHNRAKRLLENGHDLANELVQVLKQTSTIVVAASLKTPEEVVEARLAGVQILSTNLKVLSKMVQHDLSEAALKEFNRNGIGLVSQ
ncbi:MAG: transaldolase family protein [Pelolinea sp.]|nr:transaldolase family protein [Pelolinea sp.]